MLTVCDMTLFYPLEQKEINVQLLNCSIFMYKTLGGFCADFVLSTVNVIIDSLTLKRLLNMRTHVLCVERRLN